MYTSFLLRAQSFFLKKVVSEISKTNIKSYALQLKLILRIEIIINQHIFSLFYFKIFIITYNPLSPH